MRRRVPGERRRCQSDDEIAEGGQYGRPDPPPSIPNYPQRAPDCGIHVALNPPVTRSLGN